MPSTVKFQSPPPMREATQRINVIAAHGIFQSPPPMREATGDNHSHWCIVSISIPASHAGGDRSYLHISLQ